MDPQGETKMEGVRMATGAFDCPICYEPLVPPIYQCGVGHLICKSCRARLKKCPICPRTTFERCFGMERVVESIEVPCGFAKNGCTKNVAYCNKKEHEKACRHGPCFCPEPECGFTGPAATVGDHFTDHHKWPSTAFKYYEEFELVLQPGPLVLRAPDGSVFLMNVVPVPAEPLGHAVSLVLVKPQPEANSRFGCSLVFSCFTGHHQVSKLDAVRSSSLADGLPKDAFCVVPKAVGGAPVMVRTTIDRALAYREIKLEGLEDSSYEELDEEDRKRLRVFAVLREQVGASS